MIWHQKRVVLMEAIKAAYCPGFQQLLNVVQSGKIGKIKMWKHVLPNANVHSRERTDPEYGGAFLEYGGNALMPIIKILGKDYRTSHLTALIMNWERMITPRSRSDMKTLWQQLRLEWQ